MKFIKRRGSALPLALIVALIGGAIGAMIFQTAGSFLKTSVPQRRVYADGVLAADRIEEAKGAIIARNISLAIASDPNPIWRGLANRPTSADFVGDAKILDLESLTVSKDEGSVPTAGGIRFFETKVFDAAYKTTRIAFTNAADYQDLPPSFFISGGGGPGGFTSTGSTGESYEGTEGVGSGGSLDDIYKRYGAYVVQVKIYNSSNDQKGNLVRTTEEAFVHVLSADAP